MWFEQWSDNSRFEGQYRKGAKHGRGKFLTSEGFLGVLVLANLPVPYPSSLSTCLTVMCHSAVGSGPQFTAIIWPSVSPEDHARPPPSSACLFLHKSVETFWWSCRPLVATHQTCLLMVLFAARETVLDKILGRFLCFSVNGRFCWQRFGLTGTNVLVVVWRLIWM